MPVPTLLGATLRPRDDVPDPDADRRRALGTHVRLRGTMGGHDMHLVTTEPSGPER